MTSDHFAVRVVVATIAVCAVLGLAIVGYLTIHEVAVPDPLDRLVTLFAGALIGVLARTSSSGGEGDPPTSVNVVNPPGDPVHVEEAAPPAPVAGAVKKAR